jgi:CubicO group peptidase (beta-lactamase class C family)
MIAVSLAICCTGISRRDSEIIIDERSWAPKQLDDGWDVAAAEQQAIPGCVLDSMTAVIRRGGEFSNVHALLIARNNRLVYEQYFEGEDLRWRAGGRERVTVAFHADTLHTVRSVGKTITSALVGIALHEGALRSLDGPIADYFPEHASLFTAETRQITLRHALTMSAGLEWNQMEVPFTNPMNDEELMRESTDPAAFVLSRAIVSEPGSQWYYNTGLPVLLGLVLSRATGRPFGIYAREMLFDPLGIREVEWNGPDAWGDIPEFAWQGLAHWSRVAHPGGSLWVRPRDLAKFGSLYLNDGRWQATQVIPTDWVAQSTRWHIAVKDSASDYGRHGYGYHNWHHDRFHTDQGELEVYSAIGNGEQRIFIVPSLQLLVVHLAGRYNDASASWMSEGLLLRHIVPAVAPRPAGARPPCA